MPMFYFRPMDFFPKQRQKRHRYLFVTLPFTVEDESTARFINVFITFLLLLNGLLVAGVVAVLLGIDFPTILPTY